MPLFHGRSLRILGMESKMEHHNCEGTSTVLCSEILWRASVIFFLSNVQQLIIHPLYFMLFQMLYRSEVIWLVHEALRHPVQPLPISDERLKSDSRIACSQSVIHQADSILRKLVGNQLKDMKCQHSFANIIKFI